MPFAARRAAFFVHFVHFVNVHFVTPLGRICNPTAISMSICNAENESGLQILIPNAAGLQIRQSGDPPQPSLFREGEVTLCRTPPFGRGRGGFHLK